MPNTTRTMSNWEYSIVLKEALPLLENKHVRKIYQPREGVLRIDIGKESLMVGAGAYFYLAKNPPAGPTEPGAFAMLLRKHLEGKRLHAFSPYQNDRIYVMEFDDGLKLVLEQFGKGNVILLDKEQKIIRSLHRIEDKGEKQGETGDDGKETAKSAKAPAGSRKKSLEFYSFPQNTDGPGLMAQEADWERLANSPKNSLAIESALARWPVGRAYTKEAVERAGLDGKTKISQVSAQEGMKMIRILQEMMQNISPRVYWLRENATAETKERGDLAGEQNKKVAEVSLVPLAKYQEETGERADGIEMQTFPSWSDALEACFSNAPERQEAPEDPALVRLRKRMEEQEEALKRIEQEIAQATKKAAWMKENLAGMEEKIDQAIKNGEKKAEIETG